MLKNGGDGGSFETGHRAAQHASASILCMAKPTTLHYIPGMDEGISMQNNPAKTADDLEAAHGLEEAFNVALNGATEATRVGDKYTLSIWREIKSILRDRVEAAKDDIKA